MECQFEGHQLSPHLLVCDGVEQKGILDEVGAEHVQELVIPAERNGALKYSALFWPARKEHAATQDSFVNIGALILAGADKLET